MGPSSVSMAARVAGKMRGRTPHPPGDPAVGVDADEQHVDAGPRPAAEHRRGPVDQHRQVENERLDPGDLHA